jgi:hypothetical protein
VAIDATMAIPKTNPSMELGDDLTTSPKAAFRYTVKAPNTPITVNMPSWSFKNSSIDFDINAILKYFNI